MDSYIKIKIDQVDLDEVKYNGSFTDLKSIETLLTQQPRRLIVHFKNGDKIIVLGSKAKEYFAKIQGLRREITD